MTPVKPGRVLNVVLPLLILAAGIVGFVWLVYQPEQPLSAAPASPPPLVTTAALVEHQGDLDISVDGVVVPFREIKLSAEVSGRVAVKSDECRAGNYVAQGTLLIQIDARDYEIEVRRLTVQLQQAEANLAELEVQVASTEELIKLADEDLALQRRELQRSEELAAKRAVAESALDRAKQLELTARNALRSLQNQLNLYHSRRSSLTAARQIAATELEQAQLDLQRTRITAPADGVIVGEMVERDDYVQKGATLLTFEDTSAVEVKCNLRMDELHWLWREPQPSAAADAARQAAYEISPTRATVVYQLAETAAAYAWSGRLVGYDGIGLDERTRTVPCRVMVDDPRGGRVWPQPPAGPSPAGPPALVRGMYVTVRIHLTPPTTIVRVPVDAVRPGKSLWVVREGRLRIQQPLRLMEVVEIADEQGHVTSYWLADAAASHLKIHDEVVVSPLVAVTDGMPVRKQDRK